MAPSIETTSQWRASAVPEAVQATWGNFGTQATKAQASAGAAGGTPPLSRFPRNASLVFDIEIEERSEGHAGDEEGQGGGVKELRRWLMPSSTGEHKLRNDVELALAHYQQKLQQQAGASSAEQQPASAAAMVETNQRLAAFLTKLGYTVHIRTALGGGEGFECLRNLRHVFLAVLPPGAHATTNRFVVDLSFKEQFRIAKPTPRYQTLLDCLPETYVAPEAAVVPLVNFLCHEMAQAFSATGVVLPPWRQTLSVLSKWVPRKSLDEQVSFASARQQQQHQQGAAAVAGALPRRSMDQPAVQAHWVQGAAAAAQQQQQQHAEDAVAAGLTRRASSTVKPLACEPQRVAIGFA